MSDDIEELREKKRKELRDKLTSSDESDKQDKKEERKEALLKKTLTDDARKRLNAVRMVKPERAEKVESDALRLAQRTGKISEEDIVRILKNYKQNDSDYDIKRS